MHHKHLFTFHSTPGLKSGNWQNRYKATSNPGTGCNPTKQSAERKSRCSGSAPSASSASHGSHRATSSITYRTISKRIRTNDLFFQGTHQWLSKPEITARTKNTTSRTSHFSLSTGNSNNIFSHNPIDTSKNSSKEHAPKTINMLTRAYDRDFPVASLTGTYHIFPDNISHQHY